MGNRSAKQVLPCSLSMATLAILVGGIAAGRPSAVMASGCPGSGGQSSGPDVVAGDITAPTNYSAVGDHEALSLGATACNLGDAPIQVDACPAPTHPVIAQDLFRWTTVNGATRFEQIGQSWLMHTFAPLQGATCCSTCQAAGSARLGPGCSNPDSSALTGAQSALGPKYLVNPHTGQFSATCPPHPSGGNSGRLEVPIADLVFTGGGPGALTRYFAQLQYVSADDAAARNQNNNCSTREIGVSGGGEAWQFSLLGTTQRELPSIRLWGEIDRGIVETDIDMPEDDSLSGLVILEANATTLSNGLTHYEYAVFNMNSDRSIGGFSVPVSPYATVTNIGFHDVDYRGGDGPGGVDVDGTDWPGIFSNGRVAWATTPFSLNPAANAIRWGTLFNFRFDADVPAATGDISLDQFKVVNTLTAATVIPATVQCLKGDVNGDGLLNGSDIAGFSSLFSGGNSTAAQRCACDANSDGSLNEADVPLFAALLLNA
ncbi:MAG TPA: dockerin type I repeat-containing protein [Phycisphaerae bacterium]|nr:dockerin type I repeat-containing protein [Phycisphaerae bacterium]